MLRDRIMFRFWSRVSPWLLIVCLIVSSRTAFSAVYVLPDNNSHVVGSPTVVAANSDDTFASIAMRYQVGFNAVAAANPNVNPWFLEAGTELLLPAQYVLPDVAFEGIVVNLAELRLYYFPLGVNKVYVYPVGIGRAGWETPLADTYVTTIKKNPSWRPPQSIINEYRLAGLTLPRVVPPGPDNPLGDTAIRLQLAGYLLHGTNKPEGVGMRVSHGCIRLYPQHIRELAGMVQAGTRVQIIDQPIKWGRSDDKVMVEAHRRSSRQENKKNNVGRSKLVRKSRALENWLNIKRQQQSLFLGQPQVYFE